MDRRELKSYRLSLKTPFRGLTERCGLLLRGPSGWGEFAPFDDYQPWMAAPWLRAAVEAADGTWPAPVRERVPVNVTVPAVSPGEARDLVTASGCSTAKVKIGDPESEARVAAVRDALGPEGKLRIDVNGAWDVESAVRHTKALARYELEYVEQPVRSFEEMVELHRLVDVPLALDESLRLAPDPLHIRAREAADLLVLKVHPLGGVRACLDIAEEHGLPVAVSSALETSVGMSAGLALAAALPELPFASGLGTVPLFARDVSARPLIPSNGWLDVRRTEPDALAGAEAGEVATKRLMTRLQLAEAWEAST